MTATRYLSSLAILLIAACPGDGSDDTGNNTGINETTSTTATSGNDDSSTSIEESATLIMGSTSMPDPTTGGWTSGTTDTTVSCGQPAETCDRASREWCSDLLNLCEETGLDLSPMGGTNYCAALDSQCTAGVTPCELCFYLANTCDQIASGPACETVSAECLCLAVAHELPLEP